MEENEFTGMKIPEGITDPEEREFLELVNRAVTLALKKGYALAILARMDEKNDVTAVMGCGHCIEFLLCKVMEKTPQFRNILMGAIISNMMKNLPDELKNKQDVPGKGPGIEQLIDYAKKNTPAGN